MQGNTLVSLNDRVQVYKFSDSLNVLSDLFLFGFRPWIWALTEDNLKKNRK